MWLNNIVNKNQFNEWRLNICIYKIYPCFHLWHQYATTLDSTSNLYECYPYLSAYIHISPSIALNSDKPCERKIEGKAWQKNICGRLKIKNPWSVTKISFWCRNIDNYGIGPTGLCSVSHAVQPGAIEVDAASLLNIFFRVKGWQRHKTWRRW